MFRLFPEKNTEKNHQDLYKSSVCFHYWEHKIIEENRLHFELIKNIILLLLADGQA